MPFDNVLTEFSLEFTFIVFFFFLLENKGNMTEMLISILAGNPFIYKKKLRNDKFLQPYLKEVRSLQTSFGYEMSAAIFMVRTMMIISENIKISFA